MAIFIVKSVYSMKKWKNEIIRLDMKPVWEKHHYPKCESRGKQKFKV